MLTQAAISVCYKVCCTRFLSAAGSEQSAANAHDVANRGAAGWALRGRTRPGDAGLAARSPATKGDRSAEHVLSLKAVRGGRRLPATCAARAALDDAARS